MITHPEVRHIFVCQGQRSVEALIQLNAVSNTSSELHIEHSKVCLTSGWEWNMEGGAFVHPHVSTTHITFHTYLLTAHEQGFGEALMEKCALTTMQ